MRPVRRRRSHRPYVVVIGERGPSARGGTGVDLQYFVAVTGPNDAILSKRSLPVHVAIPADARRAGVTDHIEETIPLAGQAPGRLTIVLGFQQTPRSSTSTSISAGR